MVFAKKKWGQNFLVDNNLLEKIIKTIDIKKDDEILEIGPGHGALSEKIIQKTKSLKMVEIDPELIQVIGKNILQCNLKVTYATPPDDSGCNEIENLLKSVK